MFPSAFVGDMHVCPMVNPPVPPVPHVGGPIVMNTDPTALISAVPVGTVGSTATCAGLPPVDTVVMGDPTFLVTATPSAVMGMSVTSHGGTIPMGRPLYLT